MRLKNTKDKRRQAAPRYGKEMSQTYHLLDRLAQRQEVLVSDLRLIQHYRKDAFQWLLGMPEKEKRKIPLQEWQETLSYLTEKKITVCSYGEIDVVLEKGCESPEEQEDKETL